VLIGTIPSLTVRKRKDITASWLSIKGDGEDPKNITIAYDKDGNFVPNNEYEVIDEKTKEDK
jgi:hypothetical protein